MEPDYLHSRFRDVLNIVLERHRDRPNHRSWDNSTWGKAIEVPARRPSTRAGKPGWNRCRVPHRAGAALAGSTGTVTATCRASWWARP